MRTAAIGLLAALTACGAPRRAATPSEERASQAEAAVNQAITLERTPCFGGCPVYTIAVSPSGDVAYQGRANVRRVGTAAARIPKERVDALLSELDRAGFFSFASQYVQAEPATCGRYATDSPSAITTVTYRGRTKTITHDYGCGSAPGALVVLERRIDEVLGSAQWTGR